MTTTTTLKQLPKRIPNLTDRPEPITIFHFAGQYWNLRTMTSEQIKWLHSQLNTDPLAYLKNLKACQDELERRKPGPEKVRVMVALTKNAGSLLEKFSEALAADRLYLSDLAIGSGSVRKASTRYGEGLELALAGRWEAPQGPGWPYKVDSIVSEFGSLKYEVKCKNSGLHNYNNCKCDDFLYKAAGKLGGYCKHVCCVWFVSEALKL